MQTLVIDTYKVVTRLQQKGFSKDQAEALINAAQEIDLSAFATKNDLNNLKLDMIKWMVGTQLAYAAIIVAVVLTR